MKNRLKVTTKMTCLLRWLDKGFQASKIEHMKQKKKNNLFGKGMKLYKEKEMDDGIKITSLRTFLKCMWNNNKPAIAKAKRKSRRITLKYITQS